MTYSIVGRDPGTGELGVAVQSRAFNTGAVVPWGAPGIGVVATQSYTEPAYGALGLDLLRAGKSPEQALAALVAADDEPEYRQVAILDAEGRVAVHVGEACIPAAGFSSGDGFSAQANMVASERVWESMAEAFEGSEGALAERLLSALDAAEAAGGDWRGRQAGGILIVAAEGKPWEREVATTWPGTSPWRRGSWPRHVSCSHRFSTPSPAGPTSSARSATASSSRTPASCSKGETRQREGHLGLG